MESEYLLINSNKEEANWGRLKLNNVIEVETETSTEQGLVTGIITPLDTTSIAL